MAGLSKQQLYRLFVFAIIMPMNGVLLTSTWWWLGLLLIAIQAKSQYERMKNE